MIELDTALVTLLTIWHSDSKAGNPPAVKGEITKAKVVRHGNANSRNGLRCYGKNSKTKARATMVAKAKIERERIMILSFFYCRSCSLSQAWERAGVRASQYRTPTEFLNLELLD
jgi:hypothetical protein